MPEIYNPETVEIFELVGNIFTIVKLSLVIVVIVLGIFDFYKAVTSRKDDALKKSTKRFILRLIAALLIFFISPIVTFTFSTIGVEQTDWVKCVLNTNKCIEPSTENSSGNNSGNTIGNNGNNITLAEYCDFLTNESCISYAIYYDGE